MPKFPIPLSVDEHPSETDLTAFGLGQLQALDDTVRIERHLADCTVCRNQVAASVPDRVVELIAGLRPTETSEPQPGPLRVVAGYEVLSERGRGGFGVVYRARQIGLNRVVALKRLRTGALADGEELARFRREAAALARLQHPNIVQVFDVGEQEGHPYLALEYVTGPTLRELLDRSPLPPRAAARLLAVLADAVDFAHRRGIVHRDLKPGNVLLACSTTAADEQVEFPPANEPRPPRDWQASGFELAASIPKITDFGLAKLFDSEPSDQTRTGALMGTPGYMAPEQSRGSPSRIGPAVDIYALGAILYEVLTGRPPFRSATAFETFELVHTCDPVPVRRLQPHVPRDLETICLKCLRRDVASRYKTAAELAVDLRAFLDGLAIAARPVGRTERLWKWTRRRPALTALCGLTVLAIGAAVAGTVLHQQRLRRQTDQAERNYRNAWHTLQTLLLKLDDPRWSDASQTEQLRREHFENAIPFFERLLADSSPTTNEMRADRVRALCELTRLYSDLGRTADSSQHLMEAIGLLEEIVAGAAATPEDINLLGECYSRAAVLRLEARDDDGELKFNLAALDMFQRLNARLPNRKGIEARMADCYFYTGNCFVRLGRVEPAQENLNRAMDLRRQLWESDRQSPNAGADLIEMYFHQIELSRAHFPEAVPPLLAQAELLIAALDGLPVADSRAGLRIAGAFVRWGQILKTRDVPKAKEQFDIAYRLLSEIVQRQPGSRQARLHLSDVHAERAMLAVLEGRHADAILDWEQAIVLAPGAGQRNWSRIRRAQTLAECPVPQRAIDELTLLAVDPGIGPDDCLFLARSTAQAIARLQNDSSIAEESRATFINRYADLSVQLLAKAARLGFFREHPATDLCAEHPMFEGLRERDDFQALLAELRNAR